MLIPSGVAAKVSNVAWLASSHGNEFIYSASELDSLNGKPTGEVASFRCVGGELQQLSARNSAGTGTCHVAVDATGRMLVAADYTGASAASFRIEDGKLSEAVWTEHYTEHGPNTDRQQTAHAHFASFSPDNRFVYINDLGGDSIHIYKADPATARMAAAGTYHGAPGSGARTLHFHPNGRTAYCMNELVSTVDVLDWHKADGYLKLVDRVELLPADYHGPTRGCDTVITRDGRFVYFANRDDNFSVCVSCGREDGQADGDEAVELRRKDAAQFHARSYGTMDAGGESGFESGECVRAGCGDGGAERRGEEQRGCGSADADFVRVGSCRGSVAPTGLAVLFTTHSQDCAAGLSWANFLRSLRELGAAGEFCYPGSPKARDPGHPIFL